MNNQLLDLKGLSCPLPVLRTKKAIQSLIKGGVIEVHVTDPVAVNDFQAFCQATGNELVNWQQDGEVYAFTIRKAA